MSVENLSESIYFIGWQIWSMWTWTTGERQSNQWCKNQYINNDWKDRDIWGTFNRQEQYLHQNCLLLCSIAENEGQNTDELVLKIVNEKMNIGLSRSNLERTHRIGKKSNPRLTKRELAKLIEIKETFCLWDIWRIRNLNICF